MDITTQLSAQPPHYEAALVSTAEDRAAIFAIRMVVFVEEQLVPPEEELDAYDLVATHFLVRLSPRTFQADSTIVGTARLLDKGDGKAKIGRVAVLREYRGTGAGAVLMRFVEAHAQAQGFTRIILDAQCSAIPFYEKLDYVAEGDIFLDCAIEHRFMWKEVPALPNSLPQQGTNGQGNQEAS